MAPFILVFHLTINSSRPGRDEEGWRLRQAEVEASLESDDEIEIEEGQGGEDVALPRLVLAVSSLRDDLKVLIHPTEAEAPPLRRVRASREANILYGFGDASESYFGWSIDFGDGVQYELVEWCDNIQEASSNYRELQNLMNAMLRAAREGKLDGCEVFLYTDNQTVEGSYFQGTAKSRALFELIVTLYKLQMQFDFILHVVWIAGTRMIQQGTDGLSRE
jgi:hypothetical protein